MLRVTGISLGRYDPLVGDADHSIQLQDEVLGETDEDEEGGKMRMSELLLLR